MHKKGKSYKLYTILGGPVAILIIVFTATLLAWTYSESIDALNNENTISLKQRRSSIDYILAANIAGIDQGLREIRDTSSLVEKVIKKDQKATREALTQLVDAMQSPSLDILFVQLWNGAIFSSVISPFFDLSDNLSKLGQKITPAMDRGGLIHFSGLTLLLTHEPLLNSQTGQVVGRIVGATVLNDNLAVLDTIHDLTRSETVVLVSNGELISSTAPRNSEIVQKLAAGAQRETHGKPYLEADFGSNLVAGFIPISFSGNPTSLVVATAVADDSYTFIRNSYRFHLFALPVFSIFVILFMIMLVHKSTSTPLQRLLAYAGKASSEEAESAYQSGRIKEFNTVGRAMEVMVEKLNTRTEELVKTTNQLELAMHGAQFGIWDWDIESGKATYDNIWEEILQFEPSEIPEEYSFWEERIHPDDKNGLFAAKSRCMRGESSYFAKDHRIKTKFGTWVWVTARGAVSERGSDNAPKRMTGIIVDMTRRKQAEDKLRESEHRHRVIFESSPLGMVHYDKEGVILECNDRFVDLMGSTRHKLIGFDTATLKAEQFRKALKAALKGDPSIFEGKYTSVTGNKTTYLRIVLSPVQIGVSPTEVIATLEDISARKQAEANLKRSQHLLEDAQELGNMGAWEYDLDTKETMWTDNLYRLFGYRPGELRDKHQYFMEHILHPEDHGRMSELFDSVFSLSRPTSTRFRIIRKDGQERILEGRVAPQHDFSGKRKRIYGVNQDITDLKKTK